MSEKAASEVPPPYRVLARKYRPTRFDDLIGQDALVRTLKNAIANGRLAHAYLLTGVRGVGKTSTARIIARALNCTSEDGPTATPCGECETCQAIAADRHVDVLEMDAASRTGVNDIRDILDGVRYRPSSARTKVYVIDEVHMLSNQAFNALLKTLEEPPEHVTFIFATTEIRKVPVTVLSRCQRFDLRRITPPQLKAHFSDIAEKEGLEIEPEALALIVRSADGSVRDGLSLLDQASAHGEGTITAEAVRNMIGMADRARILDLFEALIRGRAEETLSILHEMYSAGAAPLVILQDLMENTHGLTRRVAVPDAPDTALSAAESERRAKLAENLSLPALSRLWQMLMKGLEDVRHAPVPIQAAEMVLLRVLYAGGQPTPDEAVKLFRAPPAPSDATGKSAGPASSAPAGGSSGTSSASASASGGQQQAHALKTSPSPAGETMVAPASFAEMAELFRQNKQMILYDHLRAHVRAVHFEPGFVEIHPLPEAPAKLAGNMARLLKEWTGRRWIISISEAKGGKPLQEKEEIEEKKRKADAARHPLVQSVLETFPGARVETVRDATLPEESS